jgi:hypothetical protein
MNAIDAGTLSPPVPPPHPRSPDSRWLAPWFLRDFLELGAYPTAPGSARGLVRVLLPEWGLGQLRDPAELVVSELVTNSVAATGGRRWAGGVPPVRLWLLGDASRALVLVWDAVPSMPEARAAGERDESGRGLFIVGELSADWGCYLAPEHYGGKVTWAIIGDPESCVVAAVPGTSTTHDYEEGGHGGTSGAKYPIAGW